MEYITRVKVIDEGDAMFGQIGDVVWIGADRAMHVHFEGYTAIDVYDESQLQPVEGPFDL